ncbi:hypothetical protein F183_A47860 [Bryobacterales bacterium F-183]|nr:hypothetical protein F183_A47860 [Bryobacterales bacterium F-183]
MSYSPCSLLFVLSATATLAHAADVTFYKDVLPVLQKNCQECHRPGEAAPMPLMTYAEARPWAKALKQAVLRGTMPPWFADAKHGKFINERRLTPGETDVISAWADSGAREGNPKDAPAPRKFVDGWNIGQPDKVIAMPRAFAVPAQGTIEYQYVIIPTGFTEDTWIEKAEVRPGNRAVNHHIIAFVRPPGSKWFASEKPNEIFVPKARGGNGQQRSSNDETAPSVGVELLAGYAPGLQATEAPTGAAKLIKAGSDIVLQLHYTANGTAAQDLSRIGLVFAKQAPKLRQLTMNATNSKFVIPAGAPSHEVRSSITLHEDTGLIWLMPHMHLRGKAFQYTAVYPTGEREVLLNVPKYDFNWQLGYRYASPKPLPKGTRIECVAHFDNSPNNPANPNPNSEVRWGDQSWEEMMIGWFDVAIDPKVDILDIYRAKPASKPTAD